MPNAPRTLKHYYSNAKRSSDARIGSSGGPLLGASENRPNRPGLAGGRNGQILIRVSIKNAFDLEPARTGRFPAFPAGRILGFPENRTLRYFAVKLHVIDFAMSFTYIYHRRGRCARK